MEQALMPINDIVITGWKLYKANFTKLLKPLGLFLFPLILVYLGDYLLSFSTNIFLNFIVSVVLFLFFIFCEIWMSVYIIKLANAIIEKKEVNEKLLFSTSLKKIGQNIWISLLTFLIVLGGIILLIVPGIFFAIWYSYAIFVNILEEKSYKGMEALSASKKLVKRRAWDTYGRSFFPVFFTEAVVYVGCGIIFLVLYLLGINTELAVTIVYIIFVISVIALTPLFITYQVLVYNSLKESRQINFNA